MRVSFFKYWIWLILGFVFLSVLLFGKKGRFFTSENRPNVIVITLDTTRADRLRCYGYDAIFTPNLDQIAEEGILFSQAYSSSPTTLPSHCSLFTGLYPPTHGVRDNVGHQLSDQGITTLAEILKEQGYQTGAFIASRVLESSFGLNQGFDVYDQNIPPKENERNAKSVISATIAWLEEQKTDPFFAWVHLYDPHQPNEAPLPFSAQYLDPYNAEIAYMDFQLGVLLRWLEEKKYYDNTIIWVTADHGESLGEHGEHTHGYFLYDATLHIPFFVKLAKNIHSENSYVKTVENTVRLIDVMPTLLRLLDLEIPPWIQGNDLTPLMQGDFSELSSQTPLQKTIYMETFLPFYKYGFSPIFGVRTFEYKYLEDEEQSELYFLPDLPKEQKNLSQEPREENQALKKLLIQMQQIYERQPSSTTDLTQESLAMLESLGYSGIIRTNVSGQKRRSPKQNLEVHVELSRIPPEIEQGLWKSVQNRLNRIFLKIPDLDWAHRFQGLVFFKQQEYQKAIRSFQILLQSIPEDIFIQIHLSQCYFFVGEKEKAMQQIQQTLIHHPDSRFARQTLWTFYRKTQQESKIWEEIERLQSLFPELCWLWKGQMFLEKKEFEKAMEAYQKATEGTKDIDSIRDAHFELGLYYQTQQKKEEAKQHFRKCLTYFPEDNSARIRLATLEIENHQITSAVSLLKEILKREPTHWNSIQSLISIYRSLQDHTPLLELIKNILAKEEFSCQERLTFIDTLIQVDLTLEALPLLSQLAEQYPEEMEIFWKLGQLSYKHHLPEQTQQHLTRFLSLCLETDPRVLQAREMLQHIRPR